VTLTITITDITAMLEQLRSVQLFP